MIPSNNTEIATPLLIPAFAAVLRPFGAAIVVATELAVDIFDEVVPLFGAIDRVVVAGMLVLDAIDEDNVEVGPTVAANANRLDVMLQQLFSPQHQLLSPHF